MQASTDPLQTVNQQGTKYWETAPIPQSQMPGGYTVPFSASTSDQIEQQTISSTQVPLGSGAKNKVQPLAASEKPGKMDAYSHQVQGDPGTRSTETKTRNVPRSTGILDSSAGKSSQERATEAKRSTQGLQETKAIEKWQYTADVCRFESEGGHVECRR